MKILLELLPFVPGWEFGSSLHAAVLHLRSSGCGALWKTWSVSSLPC